MSDEVEKIRERYGLTTIQDLEYWAGDMNRQEWGSKAETAWLILNLIRQEKITKAFKLANVDLRKQIPGWPDFTDQVTRAKTAEAKLAEMTTAHDSLETQLHDKIAYIHDLIEERKEAQEDAKRWKGLFEGIKIPFRFSDSNCTGCTELQRLSKAVATVEDLALKVKKHTNEAMKEHQKELKKLLGHFEWIANQECRMEAEGSSNDTECCETGACIMEWCLSCYARAILDPKSGEAT